MAQISRPFQLALVVVVLLAGVWLFALQGHSSSPTTASSSSAPVVTSTVSPGSSTTTPSTVHGTPATHSSTAKAGASAAHRSTHNPAPALGGLGRDVKRAHEAAAISQRQGKEVEAKAAQASGQTPTSPSKASASATSSSAPSAASATPAKHSSSASAASTATTATHAHATATDAHAPSKPATSATTPKPQTSTPHSATASKQSAQQTLVEHALGEGKVAVILFWNPKGAEDTIVSAELEALQSSHLVHPLMKVPALGGAHERSGSEPQKNFAVFKATDEQVAQFGTITRGLQVYATPTLFIVNKHGQTIVLTGLQDAFSIEQAIAEARSSES